jgi:hypothetical protein
LVDHLFDRAEFFVQRGWTAFDYAWLLWRLDCSDPAAGAAAPRWSRRSRLASQLARRFKTIAPVLGSRNIRALMFRCGVPWNLIWRAHF